MNQSKTSYFPSVKVHNYYQGTGRERHFYSNPKIELWNKVLHLIIFFVRTRGNAFISNTGVKNYLWKRYGIYVSIGGVKQAFQKLIAEGYISCEYGVKDEKLGLINGRKIKIEGKALDHLRIYSTDDKAYESLPKRCEIDAQAKKQNKSSRGRRFVRKKMYTIVDYVNMKKVSLKEKYQDYVKSQLKYFDPKATADEITAQAIDMQENRRKEIIEDIFMDIDVGFDIN